MKRGTPLMWDYGRDAKMQQPGLERDRSPNLAIRRERWKLLVNHDGSNVELYDFDRSDREETNVAGEQAGAAKRLTEEVIEWRRSLPRL
jgi:hypothetical protein